MTNFKGTKGPWETRKSFEDPILVDDHENNREWYSNEISIYDPKDEGRIICEISYMTDCVNQGWGHNNNVQKWESNALLISKAPEMLEMLEKLSIQFGLDGSIGQEIRKLIKEATEL